MRPVVPRPDLRDRWTAEAADVLAGSLGSGPARRLAGATLALAKAVDGLEANNHALWSQLGADQQHLLDESACLTAVRALVEGWRAYGAPEDPAALLAALEGLLHPPATAAPEPNVA